MIRVMWAASYCFHCREKLPPPNPVYLVCVVVALAPAAAAAHEPFCAAVNFKAVAFRAVPHQSWDPNIVAALPDMGVCGYRTSHTSTLLHFHQQPPVHCSQASYAKPPHVCFAFLPRRPVETWKYFLCAHKSICLGPLACALSIYQTCWSVWQQPCTTTITVVSSATTATTSDGSQKSLKVGLRLLVSLFYAFFVLGSLGC